ncbi:glutaredoxin [Hydrogenophaga sp. PAMC20947]|uniref:glutaredoxin n=1 Tax=Hydrogenophaga sp. PAMC20947 TaxID=2565558 RepID=UPI00109E16E4|nr:glutaredoxin [Hydrogenophaga sp. PAMC20947]QCB47830.1 glutaredoxin [Hydrogenophaga sp. PAMC20947]
MPRPILNEEQLHPAIRERVAQDHADIVQEVSAAVAKNDVVVVGMAMNPFCKKARKLLDGAGQTFQYLEYGSYTSSWRRRNALKLWTGWPTFPMVFVKGMLVGGAQELQALVEQGELKRLLDPAT